jgi:HK97 family phage major capsid protein
LINYRRDGDKEKIMANPILEKLDEIGQLHEELKKVNDERFEKLESGQKARAEELETQVDKLNHDLGKAIKDRDNLIKEQKATVERLEMLEALADRPKGSPQEQLESKYRETFMEAVRTQFKDTEIMNELDLLRKKAREFKDVTIGTALAGGNALPKEIGGVVDKLILNKSDIIANVKNVQVGSSDYQELVSIHGGTSGWVAETGTRSATGTPNLRNCKPTWGELYAYPQISEWSAQDIFFNVENWLVNDIADGMAVALGTAIWNGNGSGKPTGMFNTAPVTTDDYASPMRAAAAYEYITPTSASPNLSSPPVADNLGADDLISLVYALRAGYRQGAKFAMNSATQGTLRKLKDSNGQYLWQPSLQAGQPDMLLGYPVFTWEDMDNIAGADNIPVAFGNFERAYLLAYRTEMLMNSDQVTNPGYIRFYVRRRWGGIPLNNDAVKVIRMTD